MIKRLLWSVTITLALSIWGLAQGTVDERGVYRPTEAEIAANKRLFELLRHPTFVTLRLASTDSASLAASPPPYELGDRMGFQLLITQSLPETINILWTPNPYYEFRTELLKDGDKVPYTPKAQERVERADTEPPAGSMASVQLVSGREESLRRVNLDEWYEPLGVGHYQLTVRKRFVADGDWAESNPITFEIIHRRKAAVLPDRLKITLLPDGLELLPDGKAFRLGSEVHIRVFVVNDSDESVRVSVIDGFYGNRLQLFKDGKLMPYREDVTKLIQLGNKTPRLVERVPDFFLDPKTNSGLQQINLKDWYGSLTPGSYRLIDRRRFEIDGPWTADSAELAFEVVKP